MAATQTALDLTENEADNNSAHSSDVQINPEENGQEQQTAALLTQLQINPQQSSEQQAASDDTEPDDPHRGRHHGARRVMDINLIYMEPQVEEYERGRAILAKFPDAKRIEIASHWNNPALSQNEDLVGDWVKVKRHTLVLGVKKSLSCMPYERSCDFVAPSHANGCSLACAYCVTRGTLISTPRGLIPVEQIRDADAVFAFDSSLGRLVPGFVSGTACRQVDEVLEIQVDGTTLRVTAEHPIMTRRGWVKAGDLTEDDEVLCDDGRTE